MQRIIFVTIVLLLASFYPVHSAVVPSYEGWEAAEKDYLRALLEKILEIEERYQIHYLTERQKNRPLKVVYAPDNKHTYRVADGHDEILLATRPKIGQDNSDLNTATAHERGHILQHHFGKAHFLPSVLYEAFAETYAYLIAELASGSEITLRQAGPHHRARGQDRTYELAFRRPRPDLGLQEAAWQNDLCRSCVKIWCPRYQEHSYYLLRVIEAIANQEGLQKHQVYRELTQIFYDLGLALGQSRMFRLEEVWAAIDDRFPGVTIDGIPPGVYLSSRSIFRNYPEGVHFGAEPQGYHYDGYRSYFYPINVSEVVVKALKVRSRYRPDDQVVPEVYTSGLYLAELFDSAGNVVCLSEENCGIEFALKPLPSQGMGVARIKIPGRLSEGLYVFRVSNQEGQEMTSAVFMSLLSPPRVSPDSGFIVWNSDKPVVEGCTTVSSAPGFSQVLCPPATTRVEASGNEFDLGSQMRILHPGSWQKIPVLRVNPQGHLLLSATASKAIIQVANVNPYSQLDEWGVTVTEASNVLDRDWLKVQRDDTNPLVLHVWAEPNHTQTEIRQGLVCFSAGHRASESCVEVMYDPTK